MCLIAVGSLRFVMLFFFKQKTAYEMRISDLSSDVCSSDLIQHVEHFGGLETGALAHLEIVEVMPRGDLHRTRAKLRIGMFIADDRHQPAGRLEESRGGKECVSTCRSRWTS